MNEADMLTVEQLQQRLRTLPPNAIICLETKATRVANPVMGLTLKYGRQTGSEGDPCYLLRGGTVPVVVIY